MNYSLLDAGGLLLAALSYIPLLLAPGAAIGAVTDAFDFRQRPGREQARLSLLLGLAVLPLIDSYVVRLAGVATALQLSLLLAAGGTLAWFRAGRPALIGAPGAMLIAGWSVLVAAEWIDIDWHGALHQSFLVVDAVKHAATVQAIHDTGAPPADPFLHRPERASYYYFFYSLCALSERLCGGLVDARAAVGGLIVWTGAGLFVAASLMLERAGLGLTMGGRSSRFARVDLVLVTLLALSGLDVLPVIRSGLASGVWLAAPGWWNEQVTPWLSSLLWVPHHVAGLLASLMGLGLAVQAIERDRSDVLGAGMHALLAGACFAGALGTSVWVSLGTALAGGLWFTLVCVERRWRAAAILVCAALAALAFATPWIADFALGRTGGPAPIAFAVRPFAPWDAAVHAEPARSIGRFFALPLNYFAEFGVFFSGTVLFWTQNSRRQVHRNELARVLSLTAVSGLLLASFFRSTLYNNDLGWRVVLFPQFIALLWTAAAVDQHLTAAEPVGEGAGRLRKRPPGLLLALGAVGGLTTAYSLVALRAYGWMAVPAEERFINADPKTDRELRTAYAWAGARLPTGAVLQHDPGPARAFDFGLYGRNPVAVSDAYAGLFGASETAVTRRLNEVLPIFRLQLSASDVRARADVGGIDDLIVSARDPVWRDRSSWVWTVQPAFSSPRVRIIPVAALRASK